ncbi:hypothetical protein D3C85_1458810 [compost metagenome]
MGGVIGKIKIELPFLILRLPAVPVASRVAGRVGILNRTVTDGGPHADPVAVTVILVRGDVAVRIGVPDQAVRCIPAVAFQYLRAYGQCSSLKQHVRVQGIVCSIDILLTSVSVAPSVSGKKAEEPSFS